MLGMAPAAARGGLHAGAIGLAERIHRSQQLGQWWDQPPADETVLDRGGAGGEAPRFERVLCFERVGARWSHG